MFILCCLCDQPTRLPLGKTALPVRHAACHEAFMKKLLAAQGRPVNDAALRIIAEPYLSE